MTLPGPPASAPPPGEPASQPPPPPAPTAPPVPYGHGGSSGPPPPWRSGSGMGSVPRASHRRRRTMAALLALVVAAAIVVAAVLLASRQSNSAPTNTGPLKVANDVALKAAPAKGGCGTTFTFVATGTVSGTGRLTYRWEQSDGRNTPDLNVDIDNTVGSFALHQSWRLEGAQEVRGTMTFRVLRPTPRSAAAGIEYSCS